MNLEITLVVMSILLITLFGCLIWVIRLVLHKRLLLDTPKTPTTVLVEPQKVIYSTPIKPKYAHSKLSMATKKQYAKKIIKALEQEKNYQQPDLTLKYLARELDLPRHHLSQTINEELGTNFIDLINGYRVAVAKEKLQDEALQALSILVIGKQVGFHAKSTFYAVFKKYTNQTPAAFRKAAKEDNGLIKQRVKNNFRIYGCQIFSYTTLKILVDARHRLCFSPCLTKNFPSQNGELTLHSLLKPFSKHNQL